MTMAVPKQVSQWVERIAQLSPTAASQREAQPAYGFRTSAATSGGDALTVAAALALLPAEEAGQQLLPAGWHTLAQRAQHLLKSPPAGAAEPSATTRKELALLQADVQRYLACRLRDTTNMEGLLAALCTDDDGVGGSSGLSTGGGGGGGVLPAYCITTRPAPSGASTGDLPEAAEVPERELHGVPLTSEDVTAADAVLASSSGLLGKRFDLQKALWGCAALHGGSGEERREVASLPQWLVVTLRREPNRSHFELSSSFEASKLGPDLQSCGTIQMREAGGKLAAYELRLVLATDRDHHHHAFFWVPRGASHPAASAPGWHSYGVFADGRLAPAGGQRGWPDLLDSHMDEDPACIECLVFRRKMRRGMSGEMTGVAADLSLDDGGCHSRPAAAEAPAPAALTALSQAAVAGFVAGMEARRLQQYAQEAGLGHEGQRAALEARVREHLQEEMDGHLASLAGMPLRELQAQCEEQGLDGNGGLAQLQLRLALQRLQERFGLM